MPTLRRRQRRTNWNATHRAQLVTGFFGCRRFGVPMRVATRFRGCESPHPHDAADVRLAWADLRDELLATVTNPSQLWAWRVFENGEAN